MNDKLIKDIAISESGLIFNPVTGESYSVNPQGIGILNKLREGSSLSEIKDLLVSEYEVEPETAERDTLDFLNLLRQFKLTTTHGSQEA